MSIESINSYHQPWLHLKTCTGGMAGASIVIALTMIAINSSSWTSFQAFVSHSGFVPLMVMSGIAGVNLLAFIIASVKKCHSKSPLVIIDHKLSRRNEASNNDVVEEKTLAEDIPDLENNTVLEQEVDHHLPKTLATHIQEIKDQGALLFRSLQHLVSAISRAHYYLHNNKIFNKNTPESKELQKELAILENQLNKMQTSFKETLDDPVGLIASVFSLNNLRLLDLGNLDLESLIEILCTPIYNLSITLPCDKDKVTWAKDLLEYIFKLDQPTTDQFLVKLKALSAQDAQTRNEESESAICQIINTFVYECLQKAYLEHPETIDPLLSQCLNVHTQLDLPFESIRKKIQVIVPWVPYQKHQPLFDAFDTTTVHTHFWSSNGKEMSSNHKELLKTMQKDLPRVPLGVLELSSNAPGYEKKTYREMIEANPIAQFLFQSYCIFANEEEQQLLEQFTSIYENLPKGKSRLLPIPCHFESRQLLSLFQSSKLNVLRATPLSAILLLVKPFLPEDLKEMIPIFVNILSHAFLSLTEEDYKKLSLLKKAAWSTSPFAKIAQEMISKYLSKALSLLDDWAELPGLPLCTLIKSLSDLSNEICDDFGMQIAQ